MTRFIQAIVCLMASFCAVTASAQEAYVYISTTEGTYAYDALSSGKLTPIKGSPFPTMGTMVGTNGKFFLSQDGGYVFSYEVISNGAISKEVSKINTGLYSGSECAPINKAELDHTGSYVYVLLNGGSTGGICADLQTYEVSKTGELSFKGSADLGIVASALPSVTGNNKFAYATHSGAPDCCGTVITPFSRESTGVLNIINASIQLPKPEPGAGPYVPVQLLTPDPTNHFATVVWSQGGSPSEYQLASFTAESQGDLTSTNTWENMPVLPESLSSLVLDPTGKILAVATGTGIQLFHFNEASPITQFTGIIGISGSITQMAWDSNGHLYGLNNSGKMHVYEVNSKGITETSGSRTLVPLGPFVVRSK
jgi:hypothetical protein